MRLCRTRRTQACFASKRQELHGASRRRSKAPTRSGYGPSRRSSPTTTRRPVACCRPRDTGPRRRGVRSTVRPTSRHCVTQRRAWRLLAGGLRAGRAGPARAGPRDPARRGLSRGQGVRLVGCRSEASLRARELCEKLDDVARPDRRPPRASSPATTRAARSRWRGSRASRSPRRDREWTTRAHGCSATGCSDASRSGRVIFAAARRELEEAYCALRPRRAAGKDPRAADRSGGQCAVPSELGALAARLSGPGRTDERQGAWQPRVSSRNRSRSPWRCFSPARREPAAGSTTPCEPLLDELIGGDRRAQAALPRKLRARPEGQALIAHDHFAAGLEQIDRAFAEFAGAGSRAWGCRGRCPSPSRATRGWAAPRRRLRPSPRRSAAVERNGERHWEAELLALEGRAARAGVGARRRSRR